MDDNFSIFRSITSDVVEKQEDYKVSIISIIIVKHVNIEKKGYL